MSGPFNGQPFWVVGMTVAIMGCADSPRGTSMLESDAVGTRPDTVILGDLLSRGGPRWMVEMDALVPGDDDSPHLEFGEVGGVVVLASGAIAVLDRFAGEVRVIDPEGVLLATLGRRGPGPGELSGELTLGLLTVSGSRIALPDAGLGVIVIFSTDGGPATTVPWDIAMAAIPEWRSWAGDTALVRAVDGAVEQLALRSISDSALQILVEFPRIQQAPSQQDPRWPLLPDHWAWDVVGDGRGVLARLSRPEVSLFEDGEVYRVISWSHPAAPITGADTEHLLRIVGRTQGIVGDRVPDEIRQTMAPPQRLHALADVRIGPDGLVLVQRLRPTSEMDRRVLSTMGARGFGGPEWDVLSPEGDHLGVLEFPGNVQLFSVRGDTLVGVLEGDLDRPHVFLARIPSGMRGR